jgi:hypothetical protein
MRKPKRDVRGFIDKSIEYERGSDTKAPPGGFASGIDRPRRTSSTCRCGGRWRRLGSRSNRCGPQRVRVGEKKLADAYRNRGLNPKSLDR